MRGPAHTTWAWLAGGGRGEAGAPTHEHCGAPLPGAAGPQSVGLQWRARSRPRVFWGCCLCPRCRGSSETAPAPTSGHTQVPARAAGGGGWDCPGVPALLTLLRPPPQGAPPRAALRPRNPGGRRRPRTSRSGPGRGLWGRCTPQPSWLSCSISVCRCGETRGGNAPGLIFPGGR